MHNIWQQLSNEISDAVRHAGKAIVGVNGLNGHTSSGIVWRDSLILTAAHAIRHDAQPSVILPDGKVVRADVNGRDHGTDIALLKANETLAATTAGEFGSTEGLAVGELVVAIARTRRGNIVASSGILSGLMGEFQTGRARIDQFIRPDLMLYPGFSGGALIDAGGKILGMNSGSLLRGKPITIPASTLIRVAEQLASRGHVSRPYIGLVMQPVPIPETLQQASGLQTRTGLLVMHVEPQGPADAAGALLGDVMMDFDGETFDTLDDLQELLRKRTTGQEMKATALRAGQRKEFTIRIGERPVR